VGEAAQGRYAGLPGKGIAKILEELWSGRRPSGAYWNPTRILSDNRIAAGATDVSDYVFADPGEGPVQIRVRLLYRRAYIKLMEQKAWETPDILMAERSWLVPQPGKETPL
jgi:hypothetical protein